jgi:alpha-L-fucosidase
MQTALSQFKLRCALYCIIVLCMAATSVMAQVPDYPDSDLGEGQMIEIRQDWNASMDNRMEWWHNARYGMFIHWGPDALPRTPEDRGWRNYDELLKRGLVLNPVDFDAEEWVDIARNAGMKYIVYITKHHNGFSMYDSKYTEYDITDFTPFGRDPLKELADACFQAGIRLGIYYSVTDMHHPEFPAKWYRNQHYYPKPDADLEKYIVYMKNQIRELFTDYGQIDIFFSDDGGAFMTEGDGPLEFYVKEHPKLIHANEIMDMIRSIQPDVIFNDRFAHGTMDYLTPEGYYPKLGDISTFHNFEVNTTMNGSWMYREDRPDFMNAEEVVQNLTHIASMGGNYLLNVGPTPEGIIPKESVDVLLESGQWIKKYGESVYGTKGTQWGQPDWGRITHKILPDGTTRLFLHVFDWPEDGRLILDTVRRRPIKAYALRSIPRKHYNVAIEGNAYIVVTLDGGAWDPFNSVVVLDVDKAR